MDLTSTTLIDGDYQASVAGPMDQDRNGLIPCTWSFRADSTPPHMIETVPPANARDG